MIKNIKLYMLKDNTYVIGELVEKKLCRVLQVGVDSFRDKETGKPYQVPICMPLGYPINQKPIEINIDNLNIYFEVEDIQKNILEVYEDTILDLENPNIIIPGKSKIKY